LFLAVVSTATLMEAVRRPDRSRLVAYWLATTLLLYANLFAVLFVASEALVLALRGTWRRFVPAWVAVAVCSLPLALYQEIHERGQVAWIGRPGPGTLVRTILAYTGHRWGVVLLLVLGAMALLSARARDKTDLAWPLAAAATAPFAILWLVSQVDHLFLDRYLIPSLAAIVLLAGAGAAELWTRRHAVVATILVVAVGVICASYDLQLERQPFLNDNGRAAAQFISAHDQPGDSIHYVPLGYELDVSLYLPPPDSGRRPVAIDEVDRSGSDISKLVSRAAFAQRLATQTRVWVVARDSAHVTLPGRFRPGALHDFGDLTVALWSSFPQPESG
jgi:mannosyltransferase